MSTQRSLHSFFGGAGGASTRGIVEKPPGKRPSTASGTPVVKQKSIQLCIDAGQTNIGAVTCAACGMVFTHSSEDEAVHKKMCAKVARCKTAEPAATESRKVATMRTGEKRPRTDELDSNIVLEDLHEAPIHNDRFLLLHRRALLKPTHGHGASTRSNAAAVGRWLMDVFPSTSTARDHSSTNATIKLSTNECRLLQRLAGSGNGGGSGGASQQDEGAGKKAGLQSWLGRRVAADSAEGSESVFQSITRGAKPTGATKAKKEAGGAAMGGSSGAEFTVFCVSPDQAKSLGGGHDEEQQAILALLLGGERPSLFHNQHPCGVSCRCASSVRSVYVLCRGNEVLCTVEVVNFPGGSATRGPTADVVDRAQGSAIKSETGPATVPRRAEDALSRRGTTRGYGSNYDSRVHRVRCGEDEGGSTCLYALREWLLLAREVRFPEFASLVQHRQDIAGGNAATTTDGSSTKGECCDAAENRDTAGAAVCGGGGGGGGSGGGSAGVMLPQSSEREGRCGISRVHSPSRPRSQRPPPSLTRSDSSAESVENRPTAAAPVDNTINDPSSPAWATSFHRAPSPEPLAPHVIQGFNDMTLFTRLALERLETQREIDAGSVGVFEEEGNETMGYSAGNRVVLTLDCDGVTVVPLHRQDSPGTVDDDDDDGWDFGIGASVTTLLGESVSTNNDSFTTPRTKKAGNSSSHVTQSLLEAAAAAALRGVEKAERFVLNPLKRVVFPSGKCLVTRARVFGAACTMGTHQPKKERNQEVTDSSSEMNQLCDATSKELASSSTRKLTEGQLTVLGVLLDVVRRSAFFGYVIGVPTSSLDPTTGEDLVNYHNNELFFSSAMLRQVASAAMDFTASSSGMGQ